MEKPPKPNREPQRLAALRALDVLDTSPEERFDRFTRLAKRLFRVPIALVSLVDADRQWFKSCQGLDVTETSREVSFCGHTILDEQTLVVPDALADERFHDNPLVADEPHIRFYAGHPLRTADGLALGTLCLIDREPREFDEGDLEALADLAGAVEAELTALELATIDELTGLSNRRGFELIAEQALMMCRRFKRSAVLLFLDLDHFKQINDEQGHAEGDRVLVELAELLREGFRDSDVVARLGGDEFVVLLSGSREADGQSALTRLEEKLAARNSESGRTHALEFSVGRVRFDPARHASIGELLAEADRLMYQHKRERRNDRE